MPAAKVRRRINTCAMCRKRKLKCDATSWPCKRCKASNIPCTGATAEIADVMATKVAPRSLVLWLQEEVFKLENEHEPNQVMTQEPSYRHSPTIPIEDESRENAMAFQSRESFQRTAIHLSDEISRNITYPWIGFSKDLSLPNFVLFSGARVPSIESHFQEQEDIAGRSRAYSQQSAGENPLQMIPEHVADFLLDNYISRTVPSYPIFYEGWLRHSHAVVIGKAGLESWERPTPYQIYVINLVMAISLSTAARSKQVEANKMAFKLFQQAARYFEDVLTNDFAGLQALALLNAYAIFNPAAANVYFVTGIMMQACIDLGLHQEDDLVEPSNYLLRDIRRRVFWTIWEMDASCNAGLSRPATLLPHLITTGVLSDLEDGAIHPTHIDTKGQPSKFIFGKVRKFRLIEGEIISTLFHGQPLPESFATLDDWMANVEQRIHAWSSQIHAENNANGNRSLSAQWNEMSLFADIADPLIVVTLYRPCPKVRHPTVSNLLKAFKAAIKVGQGYSKQAQMDFGSPKYAFQPCYHVFSSAIVFLHTIRQCESLLASIFTLNEMNEFMLAFSHFFSLIAERWPAALKCLHEYNRLLEPVKERYTAFVLQTNIVPQLEPTAADGASFDFASEFSPDGATAYVNHLFESMENIPSAEFLDLQGLIELNWETYFNFEFDPDSIEEAI